MKVLNILLTLIFLICAALQYNDPDPYIWIPIYVYAAVCCWLAARGRFYPKAYLLGTFVYLIYAAYFLFNKDGVISWAEEHNAESLVTTMKATKPWIEQTREFGGLLIATIGLMINYFYSRKAQRST